MSDTFTVEDPPTLTSVLSPREQALADVQAADEQLAYWVEEVASAEADLADLQARSGAEALADPSAVDRLAGQMAQLRERMGIAHRAHDNAARETLPPRRAALLAEADELQIVLDAAQVDLDEFDTRTAELLGALEDHTGVPWTVPDFRLADNPGPNVPGRRADLARRVQSALRPIRILRSVAEGRDPRQEIEGLTAADYPASVWGPGALIPAPQYRGSQETRAKERRELEAGVGTSRQAVAGVRAQLAKLDAEPQHNFATSADRQEHQGRLAARRAKLQASLERHEADVASLQERLAEVSP
jgi:chromosome segregation ATPase